MACMIVERFAVAETGTIFPLKREEDPSVLRIHR
jgi:hypothetical protein